MGGYRGKLVVCSACNVHIKRSESVCPHCGVRRASRASLVAPVAFGLAMTGCPADDGESGSSDDAGDFGENSAYGTPDTGFSDFGESVDPDSADSGTSSGDGTDGDTAGTSGGTSSGGTDSATTEGSDTTADDASTGGTGTTGESGSGSSGSGSSGG
ncbi:MAG: hypothetical protein AAF721_14260 [Myxococcota bacterium]